MTPPASLSVALKEWAVVCRALGEGRQVVILRKGGIVERTGGFVLESPWFFLLPVLEHQNAGDVTDSLEGAPGGPPEGPFRAALAAHAEEVRRVEDLDAARRLLPLTVHTEAFIRKRWEYRPDRPLFALLLRVYRLADPPPVAADPRYAGCASWVDLPAPLPAGASSPVFEDDAFRRRKAEFLRLLTFGAPPQNP